MCRTIAPHGEAEELQTCDGILLMGFRSSTYAKSGGPKSDPRPISDKAYQANCIRALIAYLSTHGYDQPLTPKLLANPMGKDVNNIMSFLMRQARRCLQSATAKMTNMCLTYTWHAWWSERSYAPCLAAASMSWRWQHIPGMPVMSSRTQWRYYAFPLFAGGATEEEHNGGQAAGQGG